MKFVILKEKEFENFARNAKHKCYLQSVAVSKLRARNGWKSHFVGVKENNQIIAASLLLSKKRHLKEEFYALRGPLLDFDNDNVLNFFIENLKKYIKDHNGYKLRIDPYIELVSLDKDAKVIEGFDNNYLKDKLKKIGFIETSAKEMSDTVQAKFMYVIDLKEDLNSVMKDMDSKTRQMIRKNEKQGVILKEGSKEDIPLFEDIMDKTSKRRAFKDRGLKFYTDMYECLNKENMIKFIFAELDIELAKSNIEKERQDIKIAREQRNKKIKEGKCNEKKALAKEKEENNTLERLAKKEKELSSLEQKQGKKITLGAILYILYENEVASLFGGCYQEFIEYQPFYTIHYEMIKYAVDNNYQRYNFYAINNHLDENDSQYGIYKFKRGFGGHVIELLGEFILPIDKKIYQTEKLIINLKHKLKK